MSLVVVETPILYAARGQRTLKNGTEVRPAAQNAFLSKNAYFCYRQRHKKKKYELLSQLKVYVPCYIPWKTSFTTS